MFLFILKGNSLLLFHDSGCRFMIQATVSWFRLPFHDSGYRFMIRDLILVFSIKGIPCYQSLNQWANGNWIHALRLVNCRTIDIVHHVKNYNKRTSTNVVSRYSSDGRASDCRPRGLWFKPGCGHILGFFSRSSRIERYRCPSSANVQYSRTEKGMIFLKGV